MTHRRTQPYNQRVAASPPSPWLTYEIEVAFSAQAVSEEADHLVQLQAAVDDCSHGNQGAHVGVHLLVHQPEGQSFISNQRLSTKKNKKNTTGHFYLPRYNVMTGLVEKKQKHAHLVVAFCIGDAFLPIAPIGERVDDIANVPVLILYLFQDLHSDRETERAYWKGEKNSLVW